MAWALDRISLSDGKVTVQTYEHADCNAIAHAILTPQGWFERAFGLDTVEKVQEKLEYWVNLQALGLGHPMVYRVGNEIAGVTRFHRIDADAKSLEIGGTWIAPRWKRTFVNTAVKRLLLNYAFEELGTNRVEFRVNRINHLSQLNVLRLGASFEGLLRECHLHAGSGLQDAHLYSITRSSWPQVQRRLHGLSSRQIPVPPFFPAQLNSSRLKLAHYRSTDTQALFGFIARNFRCISESFPRLAALTSEPEVLAHIAERAHQAAAGTHFVYGVREAASNELIAHAQVLRVDWRSASAELGYVVDAENRRKGYAQEVIELLLHELFAKGIQRVTLRILPENEASLGLAKKLGFHFEGQMKAAFLGGSGKLRDLMIFARTGDRSSG